MGKQKYLSLRKANMKSSYHKVVAPNYVPYAELEKFINSIDIGQLNCVKPDLTYDLEEEEIYSGNYRPCSDYIFRLAKFYLCVNENRCDKLKSFEFPKRKADSFLFLIAVGGGCAPGCGLSFLVSFINAGKRIMCSNENFLVFGSNADECSKISQRFILKVISDVRNLESRVFLLNVNGSSIKDEFKLGELPNDMKFLGFLAGE